MRTFLNRAAQGDLYIRRVESIPATAKAVEPDERGHFVCAHSETGHNHCVVAHPHVKFYSTDDPLVSYLQVIEATDAMETVIEHLRSFDTHESIKVEPGNYEIRRQREYTPEGWRRAAD